VTDEDLDTMLLQVGKSWREQGCPEPPPLSRFLLSATGGATPDPELPTPPATAGWSLPTTGYKRFRGWAAAVAVAVAVIAVVAVPVVWRNRTIGTAPRPAQGATRSAGVNASPQHDPNYRAAVTAIELLVSGVTLPPGAKSVPTAPVDALKQPAANYSALGKIHQTRWWTIAMRYTDALTYLKNNPPNGTVPTGSQHTSSGGQITSEGLNYLTNETSTAYTALTLTITVAPTGSAAAIAVAAETSWTPTRPRAERIASPVSSVDITAMRPDAGGVIKTTVRKLTGRDAQRLADIVNGLPTFQLGTSTGLGRGGQDRLVFHTAAPDVVVMANRSSNAVTFTVGHSNLPILNGAAAIDLAVDQILGLSSR